MKVNKNSIAEEQMEVLPRRRICCFLQSCFAWTFKSKSNIAVLRLSGVIGKSGLSRSNLSFESVNELIEKALDIKNLAALCLIVNSPGGSPAQSELIAKRIKTLAKENKIPVYAFVEDVAASGGYWLACCADEIYALKSSIIGSIGVISAGFGFTEAIEKVGIERRVYAQGKNKSILDPFRPVVEEDVEILKHLQKQIHEHFIEYVKTMRVGRLTQNDDILFNGQFWSGMIALDFGLIDGIDDMHSFIKKKFGDVNIKYIANKESWFKKKFGMNVPLLSEFCDTIVDSFCHKVRHDKYDLN